MDYGEYGVLFEHSFMEPVADLTMTIEFDASCCRHLVVCAT